MIKKIKNLVNENRKLHQENLKQIKELEWAHIFHDSIKGKPWLENLSLNIGRWAGNYPFFYVLNRIMNDYKPKSIVEFGLGESSKFISTYIKNELHNTTHQILEQSEDWHRAFNERFELHSNSMVQICPLVIKQINGHEVNCYSEIDELLKKKYDLYIVDGPFGSKHFSRYDIVNFAKEFTNDKQFIILLDDTQREGERETLNELKQIFIGKNIAFHEKEFEGNKNFYILATDKYKYSTSF